MKSRIGIAHVSSERGRGDETLAEDLRGGPTLTGLDRSHGKPKSVLHVTSHDPVILEQGHDREGDHGVTLRLQRGENRGAKVAMLRIEAPDPRHCVLSAQAIAGLAGELQMVRGVSCAKGDRLAR